MSRRTPLRSSDAARALICLTMVLSLSGCESLSEPEFRLEIQEDGNPTIPPIAIGNLTTSRAFFDGVLEAYDRTHRGAAIELSEGEFHIVRDDLLAQGGDRVKDLGGDVLNFYLARGNQTFQGLAGTSGFYLA